MNIWEKKGLIATMTIGGNDETSTWHRCDVVVIRKTFSFNWSVSTLPWLGEECYFLWSLRIFDYPTATAGCFFQKINHTFCHEFSSEINTVLEQFGYITFFTTTSPGRVLLSCQVILVDYIDINLEYVLVTIVV